MKIIVVASLCGFLVLHCNEHRHPRAKNVGVEKGQSETVAETGPKAKSGNEESRQGENAFPSQVAGAFYPADAQALQGQIRRYLASAQPGERLQERDVVGVLAPHAGYRYSGPIAGAAYRVLADRKETTNTVVLLALSHRQLAAKAAILDLPGYKTPLGLAKVDGKIGAQLTRKHGDLFELTREIFEGEHSLEVQVPFLQVALPHAAIVPIIVAVDDESKMVKIGEALHAELGRRRDVVFVVSSDLSHFYGYEEAVRLDQQTLGLLQSWKIEEWKQAAKRPSKGMCGYRPMLAFVSMFEKYAIKSRSVSQLVYKNSGDTAGDRSRVVGYGALAFSLEKDMRTEEKERKDFGPFRAEERRYLMNLAKESVRAAVKGQSFSPAKPADEQMMSKGAAFVTLKKEGSLRGCIGHVIARVPLYQCVSDVARAAAIHDTRFSPVTEEELAGLSYEISVLTPPVPIDPHDVIIGKHGLIMTQGSRSGLLLPQVPVEWGWNREEFLAHTCHKAGLPLNCWKEPETRIESFQAIVFGEDDLED